MCLCFDPACFIGVDGWGVMAGMVSVYVLSVWKIICVLSVWWLFVFWAGGWLRWCYILYYILLYYTIIHYYYYILYYTILYSSSLLFFCLYSSLLFFSSLPNTLPLFFSSLIYLLFLFLLSSSVLSSSSVYIIRSLSSLLSSFDLSPLPLPLLPSFIILYSSSSSFPSSILPSFSSSPHSSHPINTCRYLDTLIYIPDSYKNNLTPHVLSEWMVEVWCV